MYQHTIIKSNNKWHCTVSQHKRYYKWQPWIQPILTSDTSSPEIKLSATSTYSAEFPMYYAFDSNTSTGWLTQNGTGQGSLFVQFKSVLRIRSITVKGWQNQNGYTKTIAIYRDIANTQLIGDTRTFNGNGEQTWSFSDPITTNVLSFYAIGSGMWGCIGNISISADYAVECLESESDFYTPTSQCSTFYTQYPTYYKLTPWTQPTLSDNGVVGHNSFAVKANEYISNSSADSGPIWKAFDANTATYWRSGTTSGWVEIYNPQPLKISSIVWGYFYNYIRTGTVLGSFDRSSWDTLCVFDNNTAAAVTMNVTSNALYKWIRIVINNVNTDVIHCPYITINAQQAIESSPNDYDYVRYK